MSVLTLRLKCVNFIIYSIAGQKSRIKRQLLSSDESEDEIEAISESRLKSNYRRNGSKTHCKISPAKKSKRVGRILDSSDEDSFIDDDSSEESEKDDDSLDDEESVENFLVSSEDSNSSHESKKGKHLLVFKKSSFNTINLSFEKK